MSTTDNDIMQAKVADEPRYTEAEAAAMVEGYETERKAALAELDSLQREAERLRVAQRHDLKHANRMAEEAKRWKALRYAGLEVEKMRGEELARRYREGARLHLIAQYKLAVTDEAKAAIEAAGKLICLGRM